MIQPNFASTSNCSEEENCSSTTLPLERTVWNHETGLKAIHVSFLTCKIWCVLMCTLVFVSGFEIPAQNKREFDVKFWVGDSGVGWGEEFGIAGKIKIDMCRSSPGFITASKAKWFLISQDEKSLRALNCHWYTYTLCTIAFFATMLFQNQTKPRKPVHIHLKYKTSIVFGKIRRCFQRLKQWHLIEKNSLR